MSTSTKAAGVPIALRWGVIFAIAGVAFFASYRFAVAQSASAQATGSAVAASGSVSGTPVSAATDPAATTDPASGSGGSACACCGGGAPAGPATTGAAEVAGDVQKITVDVSKGYYDPSTIELKAGIPAEITFSQSSGCTAQVQSQDLGFFEDLSTGPKTVKIDALQAGTYSFTCGMNMVSGSIVVK